MDTDRTFPALLLGLPLWTLLPIAARSDLAEGAALVALAWTILLIAGLLIRPIGGAMPAVFLAVCLLPLPFLPLPAALVLSAALAVLSAWWSPAELRLRSGIVAAMSVPPLMALMASLLP